MKIIIITVFILSVFFPLLANGQQRWETLLGNPNIDDYPAEIITDYDDGYLITSLDVLQQNTLYKTNRNGELLWKIVFRNNNGTYYNGVAIGEKNGVKVIVGNLDKHAFIWTLNECGELLWCNEFINDQNYIQSDYRDLILLNDKIIVMGTLVLPDYNSICALFSFDYDGNLLWIKEVLNAATDTLLGNLPMPENFNKTVSAYFISGFCYYAYPNDPNLVYLKAMFIKTDSLFNKQWFLPYGMQDSLYAFGTGVIQKDSINYRGYGSYFLYPTDTLNTIFMDFDSAGNETGFTGITNQNISPEVKDNDLSNLIILNDTTYMITAQVGNKTTGNPIGEFVIDTSGNTVYYYHNHPGAYSNLHPTAKTGDNRFAFVSRKQNTHKDILLYKLNADLTQAEIDTNTYVYDSLCPHAIVSDTIYLNDCDIVTAIPEFPTPEAWQQAKQRVELTAYPNPVIGNTVNFRLKYTKYHSSMQLVVYDIS
ncbi:MAG: hypothetical protein DRJ09_10720, partial [Bacteroidetes bacterium]